MYFWRRVAHPIMPDDMQIIFSAHTISFHLRLPRLHYLPITKALQNFKTHWWLVYHNRDNHRILSVFLKRAANKTASRLPLPISLIRRLPKPLISFSIFKRVPRKLLPQPKHIPPN